MPAARHDSKTAVVVFYELRQISVSGLYIRYATEAQFLDQPVLQGLVGAFDTTFSLGCVSADDLDVQFLHSPPELGKTLPFANSLFLIDPKYTMLVAVEGYWLVVTFKIMLRSLAVGKESLALLQTFIFQSLHHF
jgi:hypothetical protein